MNRQQQSKLLIAAIFMLLTLPGLYGQIADSVSAPKSKGKFLNGDNLKISGYTQVQYRFIEGIEPDSRFMLRRGRIKFTYDYKNVSMVLNPDMTEKKVTIRDAYIKIMDPWINSVSLLAGIRPVPFGFEIDRSSSLRETPERTVLNESIFPDIRDLGLYLNARIPEKYVPGDLELDFGIVNGVAGIKQEFDTNKDFVERISYRKSMNGGRIELGAGVSNFHGGHKIGKYADFRFNSAQKRFEYSPDTANYNRLAERNYVGADVQISFKLNSTGTTTLRAEYTQGSQPGPADHSRTTETLPNQEIFQRNFNGAYFYFVQDLGKLPVQLVAKYDWYDQNAQISGKDIGASGSNTGEGDIRYDTYGFGLLYHINKHVMLSGYYEIVKNELTSLPGFENDVDDNRTTVRIQFKF